MNAMDDQTILDGANELSQDTGESKAKLLAIWGVMLTKRYGSAVYQWGVFKIKMSVNESAGHDIFNRRTGVCDGLGTYFKSLGYRAGQDLLTALGFGGTKGGGKR